jgi:hypothetical protein
LHLFALQGEPGIPGKKVRRPTEELLGQNIRK